MSSSPADGPLGPPGAGRSRVQLMTRAGCHLCDDAKSVLRVVVGDDFDEVDIAADPALLARYGELIPVVLVDGRQIARLRLSEERLRAALAGSRTIS